MAQFLSHCFFAICPFSILYGASPVASHVLLKVRVRAHPYPIVTWPVSLPLEFAPPS